MFGLRAVHADWAALIVPRVLPRRRAETPAELKFDRRNEIRPSYTTTLMPMRASPYNFKFVSCWGAARRDQSKRPYIRRPRRRKRRRLRRLRVRRGWARRARGKVGYRCRKSRSHICREKPDGARGAIPAPARLCDGMVYAMVWVWVKGQTNVVWVSDEHV